MQSRFMCIRGIKVQIIQKPKMRILLQFNLYLLSLISLFTFTICGAQPFIPSPLTPLKSTVSQDSSPSPHSHPSHLASPALPEHIMLSLKHFETLKKRARHQLEHAQWSNTKIQLDLANIHKLDLLKDVWSLHHQGHEEIFPCNVN